MIKTKDIHKSFGALEVLKGIDLSIDKGEVVSIVGPSGAGKTTLLQILGTLSRPTSGEIEIDGVAVHTLSDKNISKFRNTKIGFVFQFHHLLPEFSTEENVAMQALIAGMNRSKALGLARQALERVGLSDRKDHRVTTLSGGEALPAFTLPFTAASLKPLGEGKYLAIGSIDARRPDYFEMTEKARAEVAKEYAEDKDYEVFDEIPFWGNGMGVINKRRQALFLVTAEPWEIRRVMYSRYPERFVV